MIQFYKFDIATYERETKFLTMEERGIHIQLCHYYLSTYEAPIPIDISILCKQICPTVKPSRAKPKILAVLDKTFILTAHGYTNKRLQNISKNIKNYTK